MAILLFLLFPPLLHCQKLLHVNVSLTVSQPSAWTYYLIDSDSQGKFMQISVENLSEKNRFALTMRKGSEPKETQRHDFEADLVDFDGWSFGLKTQRIAFEMPAGDKSLYYIGVFQTGDSREFRYTLNATEFTTLCPAYCPSAERCTNLTCECAKDRFGSDCSGRISPLNAGQTAVSLKPKSWLFSRLSVKSHSHLLLVSRSRIHCYIGYGQNPPSSSANAVETSLNASFSKFAMSLLGPNVLLSVWNEEDNFAQVDIEVSGERQAGQLPVVLVVIISLAGFCLATGLALVLYCLMRRCRKSKAPNYAEHTEESPDTSTLFKDSNPSIHRNQVCPICLDGFSPESFVIILPCNHVYHSECALRWLSETKDCIVCHEAKGVNDSMEMKGVNDSMEALKETQQTEAKLEGDDGAEEGPGA